MSFYGSSFSFNGISSEQFGLRIAELDAGGVNEMMGSASLEIKEDKIYRRPTPFFYGVTPSPKLSFPVSAFSEDTIDADIYSKIQKAYFSSKNYKRFQIVQNDLMDIYFDALLLDPKVTKVGNETKGISFIVSCSSPFAWHFPKTRSYTYAGAVIDENIIFNNESDDAESYLYPNLTIIMNSSGGDVTITNSDDGSRVFEFTSLSADENIIVDCYRQTIKSSTGLRRINNFNKKYLRFVNGLNHLRVQGGVYRLILTTQFISKKI